MAPVMAAALLSMGPGMKASNYGSGEGFAEGYGEGFGDGSGSGEGPGFGYGYCSGCGYGDATGDGRGHGSGDGHGGGSCYGYGIGPGYGYGSGNGRGYGTGNRYGSGHGYGDDDDFDSFGEIEDHSVRVNRTFRLVGVGCQVHTLEHWIDNWREIALYEEVEEVEPDEAEDLIAMIKRGLE